MEVVRDGVDAPGPRAMGGLVFVHGKRGRGPVALLVKRRPRAKGGARSTIEPKIAFVMSLRSRWSAASVRSGRRSGFALLTAAVVTLGCGRSTKSTPSSGAASEPVTATTAAPGPSLPSAVERAAAYFNRRPVRGDEGWLVAQAAASLGPAFRAWATARLALSPAVLVLPDASPFDFAAAEGRLWNLRGLPEIALAPLSVPHDSLPAGAPVQHTDAEISAIFHVMAEALSCAQVGSPAATDVLADVREPRHGYLLTHQLFALVLAYNQRCVDGAAVEALRRALAEATWREQASDGARVHDLALERMAVLCYAQLCDWLDRAWIDAVIREQSPSGSWGVRDLHVNPNASVGEGHTAALGLYVLAKTWSARPAASDPLRPPPAD